VGRGLFCHLQVVVFLAHYLSWNLNWAFKGTVARDFLPLVFSANRHHIVLKFTPRIFFNSVSNLKKYSFWNVVPRGLIPFRTLFPGVWYPSGLCSAGSDTLKDFFTQGIRTRRTLFCRVSDLAEQVSAIKCSQLCHCSAGSDTPQDLVPWGLIPRRFLFCEVWNPAGFCSAGHQASLAK
jgi:hypothetical protein